MAQMKTRMSLAEFQAFVAQHPEQRYELIHGEIYQKMPTVLHAYIIQMISGFLFLFLRQNPIGYALIEARYNLPETENDIIPDLSFITRDKPLVDSGAAPFMPDLAVEAQSEGQSDRFMLDKAMMYLENGTRMVWIIYSTRKLVEVLTPNDRQILTIDDVLTGGDVLPGFTMPVKEIFPK